MKQSPSSSFIPNDNPHKTWGDGIPKAGEVTQRARQETAPMPGTNTHEGGYKVTERSEVGIGCDNKVQLSWMQGQQTKRNKRAAFTGKDRGDVGIWAAWSSLYL